MTLPRSSSLPLRRVRGKPAMAAAFAAVVALAAPAPSFAAEPGEFVTCALTEGVGGTVEKLQADVAAAAGIADPASVQIDYIVVYSNDLPNHGQALDGGATGPVLCANTSRVSVADTASDTPIPASPPASPSASIDVIASDQSLQVQYVEDAETKTLLCASYADLDACKAISPVPSGPQ